MFNVSGEKYLVRRPGAEEQLWAASAQWVVVTVGQSRGDCTCKSDFDETRRLFCTCTGGAFFLSAKTLRFLKSQDIGYWNTDPDRDEAFQESANTPSLTIGKCSPL